MSAFIKSLGLRARNYGFWVSIIALVPVVAQLVGVVSLPTNYAVTCNTVLSVLVASGIVSNPTTTNAGYLDDTTVTK